jgi:hypothetical protein
MPDPLRLFEAFAADPWGVSVRFSEKLLMPSYNQIHLSHRLSSSAAGPIALNPKLGIANLTPGILKISSGLNE